MVVVVAVVVVGLVVLLSGVLDLTGFCQSCSTNGELQFGIACCEKLV